MIWLYLFFEISADEGQFENFIVQALDGKISYPMRAMTLKIQQKQILVDECYSAQSFLEIYGTFVV